MGTAVPRGARSFYPPLPNRALLRLIERLTPSILRVGWGIVALEVVAEDLGRLRALQDERAIFCPNHPSLAEPPVVFCALRRAGVSACFLTAWDTMALHGRA